MKLNFEREAIGYPMSLLRLLIPALDREVGTNWAESTLSRAVFHRAGTKTESLSEQQTASNQLRYYTKFRVERGLHYLAKDFADKLPQKVELHVTGLPSDPDGQFVRSLANAGKLDLVVHADAESEDWYHIDPRVGRLVHILSDIKLHQMPERSLAEYMSELLTFGDSWTARLVADAYLEAVDDISPLMVDKLGIAFALQAEPAIAEKMWKIWRSLGGIEEARACYSLAMLYARHYPDALRDMRIAEGFLSEAWELLVDEPASTKRDYEAVFNRNGFALLLFRAEKYTEARELLEEGLHILDATEYAEGIHYSVLTENLARVCHAMGDAESAERYFKKTIDLDANFAEYHQDYALFLCDSGRYSEALAEVEETINLDPSMPEAYRLSGYIFMQLGDYERARDSYFSAYKLSGKTEIILDTLRASHEASTYDWSLAFANVLDDLPLSIDDRVEATLLLLQARASQDGSVDIDDELEKLRRCFPDNELLLENIHMRERDRKLDGRG